MALIKSADVPASATPFSIADMDEAARRVLSAARLEAAAVLGEARREADAIRQRAYDDGRRDGLAAGLEEGRAAGREQALAEHAGGLASAAEALSSAVGQIEASRRELESAVLSEVVALAAAIARRVTKRQAMVDPAVLAANVEEALKLVVHAAGVKVAVHPEQRAVLKAALPQLKLSLPALGQVELVDDATLSPGGCRVHWRDGCVDADIEGQLDRVIADLMPSGDRQMLLDWDVPGGKI
jgi:flagellar assembly protein FliH